MTKAELVRQVAAKTGYDQMSTLRIIESSMEAIKDALSQEENVYLRGFGTFHVKKRAEKVARNISQHTSVVVPEHKLPAFKPSQDFINIVK